MTRDRDAWIGKPQPTPEMCRLIHGIDCRKCAAGFAPLDRIVAMQANWRADEWKRKYEEGQRRRAELERRLGAEKKRPLDGVE